MILIILRSQDMGINRPTLYTFVGAFINEKQQAWITAHVHMYRYSCGVAKILVSDNCKTAVVQSGNWV